MLGLHEAAQVAHHHQDVLVDGVDVEQVVLHPADDPPEGRQVATQHRPLVHPPQFMRYAPGRLQQREESGAVDRIVCETGRRCESARATGPAGCAP